MLVYMEVSRGRRSYLETTNSLAKLNFITTLANEAKTFRDRNSSKPCRNKIFDKFKQNFGQVVIIVTF